MPFPCMFVPHHVVQACDYFPPGCSHGLALVNSAAMKVGVHVSFQV